MEKKSLQKFPMPPQIINARPLSWRYMFSWGPILLLHAEELRVPNPANSGTKRCSVCFFSIKDTDWPIMRERQSHHKILPKLESTFIYKHDIYVNFLSKVASQEL